jgi:hypothetical protein
MAYRWKNYGTPIETEQAQQMQGFVPSFLGQQPLTAPTELDVVNGGTYYGGDRGGDIARQQQLAMQSLAQNDLRTQLMQLESELVQIDAQIAEIEKTMPKGVSDAEWEIAAKRAEIGDFSAYDNIHGRGAQNADPTGIENELYNAEKLTWGLNSKSGEEKEIAKANIEASLRRAEEWADKTGGKLPMSYHRLKAQLDGVGGSGGDDRSELEWSNRIYTKALNKQLTDADIKEMTDYIEKHPDRELSKALQPIVKEYKGKTGEAKKRAERKKAEARAIYDEIANLPIDDQFKAFRSWSDEKKELFRKYYNIDTKKGAEARKWQK